MATRSFSPGDGPACPEPNHGRTYVVTSRAGVEYCWCPTSQALFGAPVYTATGVKAGRLVRAGDSKEK